MTNKTKAAIEEAAKLPTAEETLSAAYKEAGWMYQLSVASGSCDHVSIALAAIESHTQAHAEVLREKLRIETQKAKAFGHALDIATKDELALKERVKELEEAIEYLYMCFKRDGIVASDFDKAKKAMRKEALK